MQLKYINYSKIKNKKKLQNIYLSSFDKDERFPLWVLRLCAKEKNVEFNGIVDNEELIGLEYIVNCEDFTYLMYLAVEKNKRKKGYGSKILSDLLNKHETVILSIERPLKNIYDEKTLRKEFYLKNGFYETNKFIEDGGVQYEILSSTKEFTITPEKMAEKYNKMTKNKLLNRLIKKMYNLENTNFIK